MNHADDYMATMATVVKYGKLCLIDSSNYFGPGHPTKVELQ